jgi:hypothetical protein
MSAPWYFSGVATRVLLVAGVLALAVGDAETKADRLIGNVEGVYKKRFKSGVVNPGQPDDVIDVEDVIELVRHDRTHLYFRARLNFYNGHTCGLWGIASYQDERFVFRSSEPGEACTLWIGVNGKQLTLTDATGDGPSTCHSYCGARGSFRDYTVGMDKRRPIKYLPRLKASREYKEAVERLGSAPPVAPASK